MASLHELTTPIPQDPKNLPAPLNTREGLQESLTYLQGNILNGHGRDHSVHIFLQFNEGKQNEVKQWIKDLAERITSAQQQLDDTERRDLFMSFFLSAKGYEYLDPGFPKRQLYFDEKAFLFGMKGAQHRLNDPSQEDWNPGYREDIQAMVLLADNDKDRLRQEMSKLRDDIEPHAKICAIECGKVMRIPDASNPKKRGYSVEHFGYRDSLSHHLFFQSDIEQASAETNHWNPGAGPDMVLVQDPYGRECDSGSYLVFRKLEQHVYDFETRVHELAQKLTTPSAPTTDIERAKALVMGRFKEGTPVVLDSTAHRTILVPNNFNYEEDPYGQKCPLQAHSRKVNPRRKGIPLIVRRGVTYGDRAKEPKDNPSLEELPNEDVGLLFMCYQRNIEKQFEYLQCLWANDPRLPHDQKPGIDGVIGQPGGMGTGQQKWPVQWDDPRERHIPFDFHGFVTLKGGEYFFAPSRYFLKNIQEILRAM